MSSWSEFGHKAAHNCREAWKHVPLGDQCVHAENLVKGELRVAATSRLCRALCDSSGPTLLPAEHEAPLPCAGQLESAEVNGSMLSLGEASST